MGASANPAMAANPYQAAAQAQMGAMGRTAQGLNETAAQGMGNYQNPYESQVVQQTLRDVGSQALNAQNMLGAQATAANAFGGSRHGIAEAEMAKNYTQQMFDQANRMRQQGFNTALGAAQADRAAQLGAAGQLAGLGGQAFGYGQSIQQQQLQQGAMQQAAMQGLIDAAKNQYQGYTKAPQAGLAALFGGAGLTQGTQGETKTYQPGLMDYLTMGAEAAGKIYGM